MTICGFGMAKCQIVELMQFNILDFMMAVNSGYFCLIINYYLFHEKTFLFIPVICCNGNDIIWRM